MSTFNNISRVFLIGIGGIGMSALARYFNSQGCKVSGYDKTQTKLTNLLVQEGIAIHFDDNIDLLDKAADLVIYTPAIPQNHQQLQYYRDKNYLLLKRSEVLGELTKNHFTIAVAGSHGKTTVSSMITKILVDAGKSPTAFLGGICKDFNSNFIAGNSNIMVVEADEFDRSFHRLNPNVAVVTAVDTDHLDVYGSKENIEIAFNEFAEKIDEAGSFIVQSAYRKVFEKLNRTTETYSIQDDHANYFAANIHSKEAKSFFSLKHAAASYEAHLQLAGFHNVENALAATAACLEMGVSIENGLKSLSCFEGIQRRFDKRAEGKYIYIDDYAHHPEEIRMLIESVRSLYPGKKITAAFQPHLFSRTKDLAKGFAQSLELADEVIVLDIYPARELPMPGVSSALIIDKIAESKVQACHLDELTALIKQRQPQLLLTIGAGDIDKTIDDLTAYYKQLNEKA